MGYRVSSSAELSALKGYKTAMAISRRIGTADDAGYRTPLFGNEDPFAVLRRWERFVASGNFSELELKEAQKFGPYYNRPFGEWKDTLSKYFDHAERQFDLDAWKAEWPNLIAAYEEEVSYLRQFLPRKLRPLSISDAFKVSRKNTNLGFPDATSNWRLANVGSYLRRSESLLLGRETMLYPFIMFKRVQPGGPDRNDAKQRPVWGADHAETFAGIAVLNVVLNELRNVPGFEHLAGIDQLESALQSNLQNYQFKFGLDLSSLDATFGPLWILLGLSLLNELVDVPLAYLQQVFTYYSTGALLTPDGIYNGTHGMPSGVAFTNLLETLALRVMARHSLRQQGVTDFMIYQNGDDGAYLTNEQLDSDILERDYATYGLILNAQKSGNAADQLSYLQRHFYLVEGYKAVMSTVRMLGRILYAERGISTEKVGLSVREFWTLNTISKLENCKRHPQFVEFVEFVASGDKWKLDPRPVLGKDIRDVEGFSAFGDSVYGTSGLAEFETVKVLLRMRSGRSAASV
jgi:hypothetical protein